MRLRRVIKMNIQYFSICSLCCVVSVSTESGTRGILCNLLPCMCRARVSACVNVDLFI